MRVISSKICPFVQRVTALLEAKGASYDVEYIDLGNKPGWFLEASPNGQVPVMFADDGRALFESGAIVEYVEEVMDPPLYPADPVEKSQARAWSQLASRNYLVQCSMQRSPDEATLRERAAPFAKAVAKVECHLGAAPFAGGNTVGMIDIAWLPLLHRAAIVESYSGFDLLDGFPRAKEWQGTVLATGLAERSVAGDFEKQFAAFYLGESTYLGRLARECPDWADGDVRQCPAADRACCP